MSNTPVIFRVGKDAGDIFALFPADAADTNGFYVTCYQHVGQHSSADYVASIETSRPALPHEYFDLMSELESIGYDDLKVYLRRTREHRVNCIRQAREFRTA